MDRNVVGGNIEPVGPKRDAQGGRVHWIIRSANALILPDKPRKLLSVMAILVLAAMSLAACKAQATSEADQFVVTAIAPDLSSSWRTANPADQGLNADRLTGLVETIEEFNYNIDSVTVIRNGYIVADAYFPPFEPNTKHVIHSITKSIVSALVGIAIDRGYIQGVDQPVLDFFPQEMAVSLDVEKQAITLEHLLTMSSGLECRDSYLYRWRGLNELRASADWVQFMLDLPLVDRPGSRFEYCNGGSFLLSAVIQEATGVSALEFARANLFEPLGITDVVWPANPQGINIGWGEMRMKPHDMAKIGQLYLNDGQWEGAQVIPADWVEASTQAHIVAATLSDGYGYQWWVDDGGYYMALGYQGQFIFVVPDKNIVVVFTSELAEVDFFIPERLLNEFILEPLP